MLVDALRRLAQDDGDRCVYIWEGRDEGDVTAWSFADLDRRARCVGEALATTHPRGARGLLMCEPGLEYVAAFLGAMYAGLVPVPAYPPSATMLERTVARLQAIAVDAQVSFAMTTSTALPLIEAAGIELEVSGTRLTWECTDARTTGESTWEPVQTSPDDVAFLQYTSGSTSDPKGVMVTHANLTAQLDMIVSGYGGHREVRGASWLPPYHDMGLVGGVLAPIRVGQAGVLMSPETFLRRPIRWLRAIADHEATWSAAPDFAYELAVRRTTAAERAGLDLSGWEIAINGAEPVRPSTVERFIETFSPFGFKAHFVWPSYGLAETTLLTATGPLGHGSSIFAADADALETDVLRDAPPGQRARRLVSCGRPPAAAQVVIVDPSSAEEIGAGRIGEVWVAGPHVAAGYWGRPSETDAIFRAFTTSGKGPFLRSGDLGALRQGELVITGRLKDLVVIRGRNHYPQDLERTAESAHADIRPGCVAAFAVTAHNGAEQLAVVAECSKAGEATLRIPDAVGEALAREHDVKPDAVVIVAPRTIPKTSSGKIQRRATREALLDGTLDVLHQRLSTRWSPALR